MTLRYLFVCNPNAGPRHDNVHDTLDQALQGLDVSYCIHTTQYPGHATHLTQEHADKFDRVVVVGGDGTLNEVINAKAVHTKTIGLIPAGSGNDFARSCGLPANDILSALAIVLEGKTQLIDLGVINDNYFINGLGFGLSERANQFATTFKFLPGGLKYHGGVLMALLLDSRINITLQSNDVIINQPTLLLNVANGRYQGNGFNVAPTASLKDGKLQIMHCEQVSLMKRLIGMYYFLNRKHHKMPKTTLIESNQLSITSSGDIALQSDGEHLSLPSPINITIRPKALQFIGV